MYVYYKELECLELSNSGSVYTPSAVSCIVKDQINMMLYFYCVVIWIWFGIQKGYNHMLLDISTYRGRAHKDSFSWQGGWRSH